MKVRMWVLLGVIGSLMNVAQPVSAGSQEGNGNSES